MSDTTVCSACQASVPGAAAFCPSCGSPVNGSSAPSNPSGGAGLGDDDTRVDMSRNDSTQVFPASEPAGAQGGEGPSAPWSPTGSGGGPSASWNPPPAPPAPAWQQPPPGPAYGPPPTSAQPAWGTPPGQGTPWGAPAQTPPAAMTATRSPLGGIAALLGALLTLVGIFTAWVGSKGSAGVVGSGKDLSGWDLTSGDFFLKSKDPYLLLVLALIAIAVGVARFAGALHPIARIAAIVVGVAIVAILIRDWLSIVDVVKNTLPSSFKVKQKFGYFLAVAGGVVTAASGLLPSSKGTPNR